MEEWKPIKEFEGKYFISNKGRVKNSKGIVIKLQDDRRGYNHYGFYFNGNRIFIKTHKLVAMYFIINRENKPFINHKNGIKKDNRVENLEWCTPRENMDHAIKTGLMKGNRRSNSHLTDDMIRGIKKLKGKKFQKDIAHQFKTSLDSIKKIHTGKMYANII